MSTELTKSTIAIAGENALIVYFGDKPSPEISRHLANTTQILKGLLAESLVDLVPSYASLLVIYNPLKIDHHGAQKAIRNALKASANSNMAESSDSSKVVALPVYYSTESGPDLQRIADHSKLSIDDIIAFHQQIEYRVYAIGFAPGFAYLGEVDPRIAMPRLSTPRTKVPRGAVAIADRQTAVYPAQSPGGWNLIGLCPQRMFDPNAHPTMPVQVGDRVRFQAISRETFLDLGGQL
ncbi:MAG: 5-oxoprolinase subunit PxpB [Porticoccaceae bacterium]